MNHLFRQVGLFVFAILLVQTAIAQDGYNIRVKIEGYKKDTCILGYRLGKKTYVKDTLPARDERGEYVFKGDETLKGGIYVILTKPDNLYFEFLVPNEKDQKKLVIKTKMIEGSNDLTKNLTIEGSDDNKVFLAYLKYLSDIRVQDQAIAAKIGAEKDATAKKKLEDERAGLNGKVKAYQLDLIKKHPNYLCAKLVASSLQPEVPPGLSREEGFYYYKKRFWDNYDWTDGRLIRTPILKDKMETWTEKLTVQSPDSVIKAVDYLLKSAQKGGNKDVFQYVAAELLNKYAQSKVICMDAVYVFIGENYYCNGGAEWVEEEQLKKICENVATLKPLRCGQFAPNIRLKKLDGTPVDLHSVKAEYVALYFWDPDCGNCSKATDKLVPVYNKYKEKGFEVFGICSKSWKEIDKCNKKVEEKQMDFINTSDDAYPLAVAKKMYDIKVNPYLILLDKNKKILWKRLDPNQVDEILARNFKEEDSKEVEDAVEEELRKKEQENIKGK